MAEGIVDELELVQIHDGDGHGGLVPLALAQRLIEAVREQSAVGEAGERIVVGLMQKLLLVVLAVGHVLDRALKEHNLTRLVADGVRAFRNPDDAAVLPINARLEVAHGTAALRDANKLLAPPGIHIHSVEHCQLGDEFLR